MMSLGARSFPDMGFAQSIFDRLKPWKVALRSLRHRNYRLFFAGQGVSLIGTWMQTTALAWLVYQKTRSMKMLGIVAFATAVPSLLITPLAGVISDRVNRRPILIITQTLAMIQAFVLAALVFTNTLQVWHIVALGIFLGLTVAFDMPTRQAFVVEMIDDRRDLSNAIALNSLMFNSARFIGPAIAGPVIKLFGEGPVFAANGLSYIAVIASYFSMKMHPKPPRRAGARVLAELREGVVYVFTHRGIRSILLLLSLMSLIAMPYGTLMPVFARDILHGDVNTYGWLLTCVGLGAIVGSVHMASRKDVKGFGRKILFAAAAMGVALVLFSQSRFFWLSSALLVVMGFCAIVQMASCNTVVQTLVPDDKRGRVMGLYGLCFLGVAPFGSLLIGWVAERIGAPVTVLFGGFASLLAVAFLASKLVSIDRMVHPMESVAGVPEEIADGLRASTGVPAEPPGGSKPHTHHHHRSPGKEH